MAAMKNNEAANVIYQRFRREQSRYACPYPPVYREPDTDYICFTADEGIRSDYWKVQRVDGLDAETLEPHLAEYRSRFELGQNQIQMGPVFDGDPAGNVLAVPPLDGLPLVKLDPEKFEPTADGDGNYIFKANPVYQKGKYKGRLSENLT